MTKILVIEDHQLLRDQIVHVLEMKQYEVCGAPDGDVGLEMARAYQPDLILCDVMMHTLNGYEVLRAVRSDPDTSSTPVVLMTARNDRDAMRYGMTLGADDFITKPFTTQELLEAVQSRLTRQAAMTKSAERALDRTRQQLVHMITHELRTPLTSINMVVDIISRQLNELEADDLQALLDTLGTGSQRLSRVIEQAVYMTQIESGVLSAANIQAQGVLIATGEILAGAVTLGRRFAYRNQQAPIDVQADSRHACLRCYPQALKHALSELISNALNFSPEGSTITVDVEQDGQEWSVTIGDRGPGLTSEQVARALELFQQINRETQEQQGMGLGLGLAHHILAAHGGVLRLESAPGQGTSVLVTLPIATSD